MNKVGYIITFPNKMLTRLTVARINFLLILIIKLIFASKLTLF